MFNKRHDRVGHLFQGRFKAVVVQKDSHLLEACRYVALNPVRARIVEKPEQWPWSSYSATAGRRKAHPSLTTDWILGQFSSKRKVAEETYRRFVREGIEAETIWKDVRAQSILGENDFMESLVDYVKGRESIPEIPKSQRFINRPALEALLSKDVLMDKRTRNKRISEAVENHGYTQKEVAGYLGLHFGSVSRILRTREKMLKNET